MSGGSYNYLYSESPEDLFGYGKTETLDVMATRLIELGHEDAAKETLQLKQIILQSKVRVEVISKRLSGVWKAVEWYDSADSGIDSVVRAINSYRDGEEGTVERKMVHYKCNHCNWNTPALIGSLDFVMCPDCAGGVSWEGEK